MRGEGYATRTNSDFGTSDHHYWFGGGLCRHPPIFSYLKAGGSAAIEC
jgi:hypothetical protein